MNENLWIGIGRLGRDPELSVTGNGDSVCNFSIAVSRYYPKGDGEKGFNEETTWVPVTAWKNLADRVANLAKKGTEVKVVGRLAEKKWEDKETKQMRYRMYVLAQNIDFGEGRVSKDGEQESPPPEQPKEEKDDLPF